MYYIVKAVAFVIICLAYATGTHEAVGIFCQECKIFFGHKLVVSAQLFGIAISLALQ